MLTEWRLQDRGLRRILGRSDPEVPSPKTVHHLLNGVVHAVVGDDPNDVLVIGIERRSPLLKLDRAARRRAFVSAPAGDGPTDRRVLEAVGRTYVAGPDYVYPYNLLHQLGIPATLAFIPVADDRQYETVDDAVEKHLWMLPDPSQVELGRLRTWLERELVPSSNGLRFATPRTIQWAVISWSKNRNG